MQIYLIDKTKTILLEKYDNQKENIFNFNHKIPSCHNRSHFKFE